MKFAEQQSRCRSASCRGSRRIERGRRFSPPASCGQICRGQRCRPDQPGLRLSCVQSRGESADV